MGRNKAEQVLHMVGGIGVTSYATNSRLQEKVIYRTKPIVEKAIKEVCSTSPPENLVIADLGCSSGPNTFLLIAEIVDVIKGHCRILGRDPPELSCFLNDLPGNDFNTLFRYYSEPFKKKLNGLEEEVHCYVAGVPGSFYGRLFARESVHFFHSSYSLMWLSRVMDQFHCAFFFPRLESDTGISINRRNIYISKTTPPSVIKSYLEQFQADFSTFLNLRLKELVVGGSMVLTFLGRKNLDASCGELSYLWGLLADALSSMVLQGLVHEKDAEGFNLPFFAPSMEEVMAVIKNEASSYLESVHTFEFNWDPFDDDDDDTKFDNLRSGENVAKYIRAVAEPILARHFGEAINMDTLFSIFANNVGKHLLKEKTKYVVFVFSFKK